MKFARANLYIVHSDASDHIGRRRAQNNSNVLLQSKSVRLRKISRPSNELVARWYLSPKTDRIECRWLVEKRTADDYLCVGYTLTMRRVRPSTRRRWPPIRQVI
jgi:hypothetical protein